MHRLCPRLWMHRLPSNSVGDMTTHLLLASPCLLVQLLWRGNGIFVPGVSGWHLLLRLRHLFYGLLRRSPGLPKYAVLPVEHRQRCIAGLCAATRVRRLFRSTFWSTLAANKLRFALLVWPRLWVPLAAWFRLQLKQTGTPCLSTMWVGVTLVSTAGCSLHASTRLPSHRTT